MATGTIDLLGGLTRGSPDPILASPPAPTSSQLTIFYSGTVNIYNAVPAEKAHAIMLLLANGGERQNRSMDATSLSTTSMSGAPLMSIPAPICCIPAGTSTVLKQPFSMPSTPPLPSSPFQPSQPERKPQLISKRTQAELPFARKVSLARFLEKRKDRVQAKVEGSSEDILAAATNKKLKLSDNANS